MTVAELIERLKGFDPRLPVFVETGDGVLERSLVSVDERWNGDGGGNDYNFVLIEAGAGLP